MNNPIQSLPTDINVELLLPYYPVGQCKVAMHGSHKRNTYNDIISTEEVDDGQLLITVGRNSLYNSLPEFMFHPIDRFDNLPKHEEKQRFLEQVDKQEAEIENAFSFFHPLDLLLLKLRTDVRGRLEEYATDNTVLQQLIGDRLTEEQRQSRFISPLLHFLPYSKDIRGNMTLLTLLLRKVFMDEGMRLDVARRSVDLSDASPRYEQQVGMTLGEGYLGTDFTDSVTTYIVHYWNDSEVGEHFPQFVSDVELLRSFVKDFFISVEQDLTFDMVHDEPPLRLSDDVFYNFLNYNTNL